MDAEIRNMPGLKEKDLAPCAACGNHHKAPVFYRVTLENCAFDLAAVQRQIGLGMVMGGNAAIARVMGPDDDMAKVVDKTTKILCLQCALETPILALLDMEPAP